MAEENLETGLEFDLPKNRSSVIKVIGIGGGGSNAVNHMEKMGIKGVDFMVCNTDAQALEHSPVKNKVQLGASLTEGLGAGANPDVGRQAAEESKGEVLEMLKHNTKMVFITAGMGGGTGTGAAPVIARYCKEQNILSVAIVTKPFRFEGKVRAKQAQEGIDELRKHVDSLIVINNDKLREVFGNLSFRSGFAKADEVLATAAKSIAEVITYHYTTNIDLRDVRTVLEKSGTAIMGSANAGGENRAKEAVAQALDSPLLNDNHIQGATNVLLMIVSSGDEHEITMDEMSLINEYIQDEAGGDTNVIMGIGIDDTLNQEIGVTVIATGFPPNQHEALTGKQAPKIVHSLEEDQPISKSVFDQPFKEAATPEKPIKKPEVKQPDLFTPPPSGGSTVVHDLYEEEEAPIEDEKAILDKEEPAAEEQIADSVEDEIAIDTAEAEVVEAKIEVEPEVLDESDGDALEEEEDEATFELASSLNEESTEEEEEDEVVFEDEGATALDADLDATEQVEFEMDEEVSFEIEAEPLGEIEPELTSEEDEEEIHLTDEAEEELEAVSEIEEDDDDLTFELDDIDGDGIYLEERELEAVVEEDSIDQVEFDPFDMSIDQVLGNKDEEKPIEVILDDELVDQDETQEVSLDAEKKSETPDASNAEDAQPKRTVHTLEDLRELEQKLQIKSTVREEESKASLTETAEEEDEDLRFEVKTKAEPSTSKQEQVQDEDFLNRPISAAARLKIIDRKNRLEAFNYSFKSKTTELLEKEPAYKRQGLDLGADNYSDSKEVSRMTLSGEDKETEIRTNNSFLHDNVD